MGSWTSRTTAASTGRTAGWGLRWSRTWEYVLAPREDALAFGVAALRCATAVPAHALFGAMWGLGFGPARYGQRFRRWHAVAWVATVLIHGAYDFVAERSGRLGNNLLGYGALLAQLAVVAFVCIEGIHLAHRHSPYRVRGEAQRRGVGIE